MSLRITGIIMIVSIGSAAYWGYVPMGDSGAHYFNQDRNAVWLEHRWLERESPIQEMESFFTTLTHHGIRYVFPHLIPFDREGRLPPHNRDQMRALLQTVRRVSPEMKVLPWVGGLRVGYRRMRPGNITLADLVQRQRLIAECRGLIDEGFDGIHLNIEPIDSGNVDFLALLRALRSAIGFDRILSLSATRPGPFAIPLAPNFVWTPDYYRRIAGVADQIVVMSYDTGIPTPAFYQRYLSYATATVIEALAGSPVRAKILLGVPTYDETGLMHRANVENPENAFRGIVAGLRHTRTPEIFEGVAIYAEWTTDDSEWRLYHKLWREK